MAKIDFLITSVGLNNDQIIDVVKKTNINASIIFGNQGMNEDKVYKLNVGDLNITVINQTSKGVSANRNTLLKYSSADYVTFWDDDQVLRNGAMNMIVRDLNYYERFDAIRYNINFLDSGKHAPAITRFRKIKFNDMRNRGIIGIFFKRKNIVDSDLYFREDTGSGTSVNHGEDAIFAQQYLKKFNIFQIPKYAIDLDNNESYWRFESHEKKIYSTGYVYMILYRRFSSIFGILHIVKNKQKYKDLKYREILNLFRKGQKDCLKYEREK